MKERISFSLQQMITDTKEFMQQARVVACENNRSAYNTEQFNGFNFWLNVQICFSVPIFVFSLLLMKYEWAQIGYHASMIGFLAAGVGVIKYRIVRYANLYRLALAVYAVAYTFMVAMSLWCKYCDISAYITLSVALIGVWVSALYAAIIITGKSNTLDYIECNTPAIYTTCYLLCCKWYCYFNAWESTCQEFREL
jgi:hypothetical protein